MNDAMSKDRGDVMIKCVTIYAIEPVDEFSGLCVGSQCFEFAAAILVTDRGPKDVDRDPYCDRCMTRILDGVGLAGLKKRLTRNRPRAVRTDRGWFERTVLPGVNA
jgi:hypothetical protein